MGEWELSKRIDKKVMIEYINGYIEDIIFGINSDALEIVTYKRSLEKVREIRKESRISINNKTITNKQLPLLPSD